MCLLTVQTIREFERVLIRRMLITGTKIIPTGLRDELKEYAVGSYHIPATVVQGLLKSRVIRSEFVDAKEGVRYSLTLAGRDLAFACKISCVSHSKKD